MKSIILTVLVAAFLYVAPAQASSNLVCKPRKTIVDQIIKKYKEKLAAVGTEDRTGLVETYVSKTGTWTIIVTGPSGVTCVIMTGKNWKALPKPLPGIPS